MSGFKQLRAELDKREQIIEETKPPRPDSPAESPITANPGATISRATLYLQSPRLELPPHNAEVARPACLGASTTDVYHMMWRWNLEFSGTRGDDAEAFLTRIQERRTLISVTDEEMFKCIPFFLSGITLYWYRNEGGRWRT